MIFKKIVLKKNSPALILSLLLSYTADAQLTVSTAMTPTQLVQNVLLGSGVTASNITYNGSPIAIGSFNGAASNIGLPAGVILATGDINTAVGPNNSGSAGTNLFEPSDPDLDAISANTTYDRAVLEFDFVPVSDTVKFRYTFGSEEYMEFVNAGVNDVFGFFISGPGITGPYSNNSKNIALIPGTSTPVTIDNVNANLNPAYYFDNENPPGQTIQYDGFTVPLTAVSAVQCGQTYHIKIAIADAGDGVFDSGVFLEAGSFSSSGVSIISAISYGGANDSTLYEGCGAACIYFVRGSNLSNPDTINLIIGGTAVNGTDYYDNNVGPGTLLPTQLFFAPGQDSISFCLNAVADGIAEGQESIVFTITATGTGFCIPPSTTATIYLNEYTPLVLNTSNDTTLCNVLNPIQIAAYVTGGVQPYTYSWTNGAGAIADPTVNPTINTTYIVTVNDACNGTPADPTPAVIDSVTVSLEAIPVITASVSYGGANDSTFYEGCGQACIYFVRTINVAQPASYTLNINGTADNGIDYIPALPAMLVFAAGQDSLSYCISAVADGTAEAIETILLSINVSGVCNLSAEAALYIAEPAPITLTVNNDTALCNIIAPIHLSANVSGGVQPYSYSWTNGAGATANPTVNPTINTTYIVTVNDACNANPTDPTPAVIDSVVVSVVTIPIITSTVSYGGANDSTFYEGCGQACIYFVRTIGIAQSASYTLNIGGTASNGIDYSPALPTLLTFAAGQDSLSFCINAAADGIGETTENILLSINITGVCDLNANSALYIAEPAPILITTNNDTVLNCTTGPVDLFVNVNGGVQPYTFLWSNIAGSVAFQTVIPYSSTTYTITVSDACGGNPDPTPNNSDSIQVTLNIPLPLSVDAGIDITACPQDIVNLSAAATGGAQPLIYLWTSVGSDTVISPGSANTSAIVSGNTSYAVSITDNCGNHAGDDISVNAVQNCLLNIPNIITPDGRGIAVNETFYIDNLDRFPVSSLVI